MPERNYWSKMKYRNVSRRTLLRASARAGVGAAGLALVGCGDDDDDQPAAAQVQADQDQAEQQAEQQAQQQQAQTATAEEQQEQEVAAAQAQAQQAGGPVYGGMVQIAGDDGGLFDPAATIHGGTDASIFQCFDFVNYMDDGNVITDAMGELPEIVDDVNFVYQIKPDVYWQDLPPVNGRQFTAEDAVFGYERFSQDNPEFVYKDRYSLVERFEAVDQLTMHVQASEPFAPLLVAMAETGALMVARDVVEQFGDAEVSSNPDAVVGTGSMMLESREPDVETVLKRNPNYYRKSHDGGTLPYFDGYNIIWGLDNALRIAQYIDGKTDFLWLQWYGELQEIETVRAEAGEDSIIAVPNPVAFGLATHIHTKREPYTDPRVRKALHLATDRPALNAITLGAGVIGGPVAETISPYGWGLDQLSQLPGYRSGDERETDLAEGRQLLEASGYDPDSVPPMEIWGDFASDYGQVLQQNFREIGFEVDILELTTADSLAARQNHEFSMITLGQQAAADPDLLYNDLHTTGGQNYGEFSDPEIDEMLVKGRTTFGVENRKAIYDEIQEKLLDEHLPRLWWHWSLPTVGHRPWLQGFRPTPGITPTNQVMNGCWFDDTRTI